MTPWGWENSRIDLAPARPLAARVPAIRKSFYAAAAALLLVTGCAGVSQYLTTRD